MIPQRNPNSPYIREVRPLTPADFDTLRAPSARNRISKLRDVHHNIARMIVSGLTTTEIAVEIGYTISRVSTLRNSPAMLELVETYRADAHTTWKRDQDTYFEYIRQIGLRSARKLLDKLDEDDDNETSAIPFRDLQRMHDSASDRVGYHRKTAKENINIDFAARLETAIANSRKVTIIDAEPI